MVKHIHIYLDDVDYEKLIKVKGKTSWHDYLLSIVNKKE